MEFPGPFRQREPTRGALPGRDRDGGVRDGLFLGRRTPVLEDGWRLQHVGRIPALRNPTYEEVCTGGTGHAEVVLVAYRPEEVSYEELLKVFWETHDPTQGMQQGNASDRSIDLPSTPRPTSTGDRQVVPGQYQAELTPLGFDDITTEITPLGEYYYAEDYHQQYLAKNPHGYDCHANTGIAYPVVSLLTPGLRFVAQGHRGGRPEPLTTVSMGKSASMSAFTSGVTPTIRNRGPRESTSAGS